MNRPETLADSLPGSDTPLRVYERNGRVVFDMNATFAFAFHKIMRRLIEFNIRRQHHGPMKNREDIRRFNLILCEIAARIRAVERRLPRETP